MLHFLWILFLLWVALAVLYGALRILTAFGRRFDSLRNPPAPRDLERERSERAKHEAHMGR
jgi:hypothetical protein